jgi:hypothetical protein
MNPKLRIIDKEMKMKTKYCKPIARELNNLTPAIGLCASGQADGGCISGSLAGGSDGCQTGTNAVTKCVNGSSVAFATLCNIGTGFA